MAMSLEITPKRDENIQDSEEEGLKNAWTAVPRALGCDSPLPPPTTTLLPDLKALADMTGFAPMRGRLQGRNRGRDAAALTLMRARPAPRPRLLRRRRPTGAASAARG